MAVPDFLDLAAPDLMLAVIGRMLDRLRAGLSVRKYLAVENFMRSLKHTIATGCSGSDS